MKQLLVAAILTLACFGAKAQTPLDIFNNNGCEFEIRAICIDETAPCSHTVVSGWTTIPVGPSVTPFNHPGCTGTGVMGYEVRYAGSSGCSASVFFSTNPATPCPTYPNPHNNPGPCSCGMNPNGADMDITGGVGGMLTIQP